jgi:RNA polymerase sigma-70 factor, ECF subfamily
VALASSYAQALPVSKMSPPTKRWRGQASAETPAPAIQLAPTLTLSDAELVRRALSGDAWAEEAIYRRYAARILALTKRLLGDSAEAEDATQETFIIAFAAWKKLRDSERLCQWLVQIAVSRAHRRFRRRRLLSSLGFCSLAGDASLDALARQDCPEESRVELALIGKALERVSAAERIAWILRHVEGMSLDEVAQQTASSLATAKRRIARAAASIQRLSSAQRSHP